MLVQSIICICCQNKFVDLPFAMCRAPPPSHGKRGGRAPSRARVGCPLVGEVLTACCVPVLLLFGPCSAEFAGPV